MLKIFFALFLTLLFILSLFVYKKKPLLIGYFFLECITFLNLSSIIYILLKNNIFNSNIDTILVVITLIIMSLIFFFLLIPHFKIYKEKYLRNMVKEISINDSEFYISSLSKYSIQALTVISLGGAYYLIYYAKDLPFQKFNEYPIYSKVIIIIGFFVLALLIFKGNRKAG